LIPTFMAYQIAGRAMSSSRANIDVTGNNIANVNTPGYTRQRVDLNSISSSGYTEKYSIPKTTTGFGVEIQNISQIRDPFLDIRFRNQNAENGTYDVLLAGLSDLENIFDEADTEGLQSELSNFQEQLQIFSQTPTSKDVSLIVRTAAQKVTQIMNVYARQTEEVRAQQIYDLDHVIIQNSFNAKVKNIADLNLQIRDELIHGNTPNELFDQRNILIDELSGLVNIKVTALPEKISENLTIENLNISIYDSATSGYLGIVSNGQYNTLSVADTGDSVEIRMSSSFGPFDGKDISANFSEGSIKGYLDLINGKGAYADPLANENTFHGTMYYKSVTDTLAANFASLFNDLNTDAAGTVKPLFVAAEGTAITAGNIRISDAWLSDSAYITTTTSDLTGTGGEGDNILRMISGMNSDIAFTSDPTDPTSQVFFTGTFAEYTSGLIAELSLEVELNQNFSETAATVLSNLSFSRESISGVSLDEEGINLMAYQKSYQAAARYFTALDEAVDIIINKMGLVGR